MPGLTVSRRGRWELGFVASALPDRRLQLHDQARVPGSRRQSSSRLLQFYSGVDNIGNLLPVLGIQRLLGQRLDVWDVHDPQIDWDFVNNFYRGAIIGGAGLLHPCFERFWAQFLRDCRLPAVIWGVGGCYPHERPNGDGLTERIKAYGRRFDLVDVRDEITAERFGFPDASVTPCPSIAALRPLDGRMTGGGLLVRHPALARPDDDPMLFEALSSHGPVRTTTNYQSRARGAAQILRSYARARVVATTRLHGLIIAAALGRSCVALARDDKVRAYVRAHGGGSTVDDVRSARRIIADPPEPDPPSMTQRGAQRHFAAQVRRWAVVCGASVT